MNDYENLYHCNYCRSVRLLEQDGEKLMDRCPACEEYGSHYRIGVGEIMEAGNLR